MTDDSGAGQDGTIVDEALVDLVLDQIDDQCHSATNATTKPKDTTDEVVTARGSAADLDTRLDKSLDADGGLNANVHVDTTPVGNVGAGTDDLMSWTVPADQLEDDDQDELEGVAWGEFAANANNKSILLVFGSTSVTVLNAVAVNSGSWRLKFNIVRTGAATQELSVELILNTGTACYCAEASPTETLSGTITLKLQGIGVANDDVLMNGWRVRKV